MADKACEIQIDKDGNRVKGIEISSYEAEKNKDYFCPEEKCFAIMRLVVRENARYFAAIPTYPHKPYCMENKSNVIGKIGILSRDLKKLDWEKICKKITRKAKEVVDKGELENKSKNISKEGCDQTNKVIKDYEQVPVVANGVVDLYTVLKEQSLKNHLGSGEARKSILVNRESITDFRNGEIELDGFKMVIARTMGKNTVRDKYQRYKNEFCVVLRDPYTGGETERIYYVLRFINDEIRKGFLKELKRNTGKTWLILGKWNKDVYKSYKIYATVLKNLNSIKVLPEIYLDDEEILS